MGVFNVLFRGSSARLLPKTMQMTVTATPARFLTTTAGMKNLTTNASLATSSMSTMPSFASRGGGLLLKPLAPQIMVRSYGTRSVWNVKKGKFWLFAWFAGGSMAACFMQEFGAEYFFRLGVK